MLEWARFGVSAVVGRAHPDAQCRLPLPPTSPYALAFLVLLGACTLCKLDRVAADKHASFFCPGTVRPAHVKTRGNATTTASTHAVYSWYAEKPTGIVLSPIR